MHYCLLVDTFSTNLVNHYSYTKQTWLLCYCLSDCNLIIINDDGRGQNHKNIINTFELFCFI